MESSNCNCDRFPEATFMKDDEDKVIYVDSLFCPQCFRQIVHDGNYTQNQYYEDKRKERLENE